MQSRPLRPFEQGAHLHVLDWAHQTARYRFQQAGAAQVKAASRTFAHADIGAPGPPELPALAAALSGELQGLYALGYQTVRSELDHQRTGDPIPVGLSHEAKQLAVTSSPGDPGNLAHRGRLAAQAVTMRVWQSIQRTRLQGVTGSTALRSVGEEAGLAALRSEAASHAGGAINAGRRAAAQREAIGARYTSILDKSTCEACASADDGVLRSLKDPALVHPPNPSCAGGDRCRCILVYALESEVRPLPVLIAAASDSLHTLD